MNSIGIVDVLIALLVCGQCLLLSFCVWLMLRQAEQRTRIAMMPTHQDLSELTHRLAAVEATTQRTLVLVDTIHTSLLEQPR